MYIYTPVPRRHLHIGYATEQLASRCLPPSAHASQPTESAVPDHLRIRPEAQGVQPLSLSLSEIRAPLALPRRVFFSSEGCLQLARAWGFLGFREPLRNP